MNCYNHSDQPAVSTCIDCGKGLCSECSNKYTIFICDSCNLNRLYTEKSSIETRWIISIAIAVSLTFLNFKFWPEDFLFYLIMFPSMIICIFLICMIIQYGWRALNSIMPPISFVVSFFIGWFLLGWFLLLVSLFLYFAVRLTLSSFIGLIITPMMLFKDVKRYKEVKRTIKYIKKE